MDLKWNSIYNPTNNQNNINQNNWDKYKKYQNWNYKKNGNIKNNRYSAGILPYTYDLNGNCLILLGKDHEGDWSDFGGRCESKDNFDQKYTASREFYEETLGSILSISECIDKINSNEKKIISKTLNGSPYYMFIIYIDYYNYYESFTKTSNFMKYYHSDQRFQLNKLIEKSAIKWFNINLLFNNTVPLRNVFLKTLEASKDDLIYMLT
jgi:hypothetical protein